MSSRNTFLISIILPTFNRDNYLIRSINSVISQTFDNWELIIWDDGSTDNSKYLIDNFKDSRISYYYSENKGAAAARNNALDKSSGEYIAFIDSDDIWMLGKLSEQVKVFQNYPNIDFLFTDFENLNIEKKIRVSGFVQNRNALRSLKTTRKDDNLNVIDAGFNESLAISNFIALDSVIIRREVFDRVGRFDETLRNSEDFELWWRMGLKRICFAYLNKVLMSRYKPAGSLSSHSVNASLNTLMALDICKENSVKKERQDLVPHLHNKYRNTWQNLILAYAKENDKEMALDAFSQSLKFGFRLGSLRLLIQALFLVKRNAR